MLYRLLTALSFTLLCIAVELGGFFLGLSMFSSLSSMFCILDVLPTTHFGTLVIYKQNCQCAKYYHNFTIHNIFSRFYICICLNLKMHFAHCGEKCSVCVSLLAVCVLPLKWHISCMVRTYFSLTSCSLLFQLSPLMSVRAYH